MQFLTQKKGIKVFYTLEKAYTTTAIIKTSPFVLLFPLLHNRAMLIKSGLIIICDSHGSCHILLHKGQVQFQTMVRPLTRAVNAGAWFDQIPVRGLMLLLHPPASCCNNMQSCRSPRASTVFHQVPRPLWWHSSSANVSGRPRGRGPQPAARWF